MFTISNNFDIYTWRARILPTFLVFLPAILAFISWFPQISLTARLAGIGIIPFGIAMLLSQIGRDLGYKKQSKLWQKWDGNLTVQMLQHRNLNCNPILRERYHRKLKELQPEISIPTLEEETKDPKRADHAYETCVQFLISQTRDPKQFPLIFKENINYGFRRNLWGFKPIAIVLTLLGLLTSVSQMYYVWKTSHILSNDALIISISSLGFLVFWLFWINPDWVRISSQAYAERLLEACEQLKRNTSVVNMVR